jgi:uncharacterized protein (TIRG00374 family)
MRLGWRGVVGIALSVILLAWTLKDVSLANVWRALAASNLLLLILAACVATLSFPLRAWRWRYILHPIVPALPYGPLWRSTAIGMMVNNVVPARAGELARAYALSREVPAVGFAAALGSLVVDRLFDTLVVLVFLLVVISASSFPEGTVVLGRPVENWLRFFALLALIPLFGLGLVAFLPERMVALWNGIAVRVVPRFAERGVKLLRSFASGLGVLRDPVRFAIVLFWAIVQWLVNGLSFWIGFKAMGITASFTAAIFLQSVLAMAVALPSSPGFFGVFEAASKAALSVYGVDETLAVSFAIGYHLLSFIPITAMGFWYFARMGLHFRDLKRPPSGQE